MIKAMAPNNTGQPSSSGAPLTSSSRPHRVPTGDIVPEPPEISARPVEGNRHTALYGSGSPTSSTDMVPHDSIGIIKIDSVFAQIKLEYDPNLHPRFPDEVNDALRRINISAPGKQLLGDFSRCLKAGKQVTIRPAENSEKESCSAELSDTTLQKTGKASAEKNAALAEALAQKRLFGLKKGPGTNAGVRWTSGPAQSQYDLARELVHARRIVKGTYMGGRQNGDPLVPGTRAAREERRAIGIGEYTRTKGPSENSIRRARGVDLRIGVEKPIVDKVGAVRQTPIPPPTPIAHTRKVVMSENVTQEDIRKLVFEDQIIKNLMKNPKNNCDVCAERVRRLLNENHVPHTVRGMLIWHGLGDINPGNHFVVVASIQGQRWAVDPTAAQFEGCEPMLEPLATWEDNIRAAESTHVIKYVESATVSEAKRHASNIFIGSPLDFDGETMNSPNWHKKMVANPELFRSTQEKLEKPIVGRRRNR